MELPPQDYAGDNMSKKQSKIIIENAIQAAINGEVISEGPVDFAKSVAGGAKGAFQGVTGNFRANRAKTYMDTFAKKTQKSVAKYGQKAKKIADKMSQSRNDAVSATGDRIAQEIEDTEQRVQDLTADINQSFPSSISPSQQTKYGSRAPSKGGKGEVGAFRDWFNQNYDVPWDSIGKSAQSQVIDQYVQATAKGKEAQKIDNELEQELISRTSNVPDPADKIKVPPEDQASIQKKGPESIISRGMSQPPSRQSVASPAGEKPTPPAQKPPGVVPTPQPQGGPDVFPKLPRPAPPQASAPQLPAPKTPTDPTGRQAIVPPTPQGPQQAKGDTLADKGVKTPNKLGLSDIGVSQNEFGMINKAIQKRDSDALAMYNAMKFGDEKEAKSYLDKLRKSERSEAGTQQLPKAQKKMELDSPPEKDTANLKKVVNKSLATSAGKYKVPSPDDVKSKGRREFENAPTGEMEVQPGREPTAPIPLTQKKKRETNPYQVSQEKKKKIQPGKEAVNPELDEGPIMSMSDFMARSADDPDQARQAKEKIDQERKASKRKKKSKKDKKVVIVDRDMNARKENNFVPYDKR